MTSNTRRNRRSRTASLAAVVGNIGAGFITISALASQAAADEVFNGTIDTPLMDRWNYPFNQSPGARPNASIFGAFVGEDLSPDFDNRDAQYLCGFETSAIVEPNLGPASYTITQARVRVMVSNDLSFLYDATFDSWQSYLPSDDPEFQPDETPGRPFELFGVGFRNDFEPLTYQEDTPYSPFGPFGKGVRTAYAIDLPAAGEPRDVSNNVDEGYDPIPFAIGQTDAVAPGAFVPEGAVFTFDVNVDDAVIQAYLREALDRGRVHFMAASLFPASEKQTGSFPELYCKENLLVIAGLADAASLELTVKIGEGGVPGDLNGDGVVNVLDLLALLSQWGNCPPPDEGDCSGDLNDDNLVNVLDLLALLSNWGTP